MKISNSAYSPFPDGHNNGRIFRFTCKPGYWLSLLERPPGAAIQRTGINSMYVFIDTETTGTGPEDRLCQIAFKAGDGDPVCRLFNPGMPITVEAMSIHHITNEMVADQPVFRGSRVFDQLHQLVSDPRNHVVAHNARFDVGILAKEGIEPANVICTLKLSRYLDPKGAIPKYNLQYLRYFLNLQVNGRAHDALGDVLVLAALFDRILLRFRENGVADIPAEMVKITKTPVLLGRINFGKHKGTAFSEIPRDYLKWLSQKDLDEDLAYTVRAHLLGEVGTGAGSRR
jgi:DNA polymerase III epsilon subunit-like protein